MHARVALPAEPAWNELEIEERLPHPSAPMEEQVDALRGIKRLSDCELPDGFRLVWAVPRQMWIEQQVRWAIVLGFTQVGRDEVLHVSRYEPHIPDGIQMRWAMGDFARDLSVAGYAVKDGLAAVPDEDRSKPRKRQALSTQDRMLLGMIQ